MLLLLAGPALGGVGDPVVTDHMETRLLGEYAQVEPGQRFWVAVEQQMRPGWHTYWRNPGDSGEPTELDWQLPDGWTASDIHWPIPERIAVGPLVSFGYPDEALLLVEVQAPDTLVPGQDYELVADAYWLICEEECIPEEGLLTLVVTAGDRQAGAARQQIQQAAAALPVPWPGTAQYQAADGRLVLDLELPADPDLRQADYFPYAIDSIDHAATQTRSIDNGALRIEVPLGFAQPDSRAGIVVLTEQVDDSRIVRAYEVDPQPRGRAGEAAAAGDGRSGALAGPAGAGSGPGWLAALGMALVGGMILNLMPCVFPVLSIKLLALMQLGGGSHGQARIAGHGLIYGIGVLAGFVALALVLIALRSSGMAVGWGFHLQNPVVVVLLAWLFFLIGLNLSGVFEFGQRLMGVGQGLTQGHGHRQSFFTGLLATVVATPCTAPLMGVALGYALVQPPAMTLLIFVGLGAGMALPFVLLCAIPGALNWLPRPGPWMLRFKEALAFPMYASAIWLVWVLTQQTGSDGVIMALGGAVTLALVIWLGRLQSAPARAMAWTAGIGGMALWLALIGAAPTVTNPGLASDDWLTWSEEQVREARTEGPVFVNFTADWCITCKANERIAIETSQVRALFEAKDVTRIKADWTNRDDRIARGIEAFNRSGVPLYVFYPGPDAEPQILPQLLTERMMVELLAALPDPA